MRRRPILLHRVASSIPILAAMAMSGVLAPSSAAAQGQYVVRPVAEMKIKQLPKGPLYWRIENFSTLDQAKAATMWQQLNDIIIKDFADIPLVDRKFTNAKIKALTGPESRAFDSETWNIADWKKA